MEFLNNLGVEKQQIVPDSTVTTTSTTAETTTERKVPTLHVEEILPKMEKTTIEPSKENEDVVYEYELGTPTFNRSLMFKT